jgi:hypothetical protein
MASWPDHLSFGSNSQICEVAALTKALWLGNTRNHTMEKVILVLLLSAFISLSMWMGMFSGEAWGFFSGKPYWKAPVPDWAGKATWAVFVWFLVSLIALIVSATNDPAAFKAALLR